jgi:tetratricopeptide (TPR) repeat protein
MSIAYEYEFETEGPAMEAEAFLESVQQAARSGRRYRPLALAAMAAARAALSEGRYGDVESEFESSLEGEWEVTPQAFHQSFVQREAAPSAALMEHLGHAAAEAESNGEAFAFLAPLLPLALKALPLAGKALGIGAKLLPKVASKVVKVAPKLIKGVNAAAKSLRANPATKQLVQALPQVVRRTAADLAQQAAQGKPVTGEVAVRALANQTAQLLGNPQAAIQALDRAKKIDHRVDQAVNSMVQGGLGAPAAGAAPGCTCGSQPE